jgi:hypothetical protein
MKWPWVARSVYEEALRDKRVAEDRLYAAWKEGNQIPPRDAVTPKTAEPIKMLPEKLHSFVQNWESPEVRADLEREARLLHFDLGMTEDRVLQLWQDRQGGDRP